MSLIDLDRNVWLLIVFVSFVGLIFVFARIYYGLYRRRRENFSFNGEIQTEQAARFQESTLFKIADLSAATSIITECEENITDPYAIEQDFRYVLPSGAAVKFTLLESPNPVGNPNRNMIARIFDKNEHEISRQGFGDATTAEAFSAFASWRTDIEVEISQLQARLATISSQSKSPDVWGHWDFLYFSTITQTTVGYGDILPNSTTVRKLVMVQILTGYALLVVALNLVFGTSR